MGIDEDPVNGKVFLRNSSGIFRLGFVYSLTKDQIRNNGFVVFFYLIMPICHLGSGHTVLAVYYQRVLNKSKFKAYIASDRTGSMGVELLSNNRVLLNGSAVVVLQGTINLPK